MPMTPLHHLVPRMLGPHGEHRTVSLVDVERWMSAGTDTDVGDQVIARLVVATSHHKHAGRVALGVEDHRLERCCG